ncbi:MAG: SDR family oxidoreductase [Gammaproteobacteria bacterium]|nr:SDR family oxidoreductase [Gammaproteobacteria bacterium]
MTENQFKFGMSEQQLWEADTVYANDALAGNRVLVSGGGSGIGQAIAWLLARLGAAVIITGRDHAKLEAASAAMQARGLDARHMVFDIRDADAVAAALDSAFADAALDILVNNAGGQFPQPAIDFSPNGWRSVIDNNLNGTWFMMQAAAQRWRDAGRPGNIINIATVIDKGMTDTAHTCAARAGVIYASKTVAVEWAPLQIRVNCIAPGVIDSEGMKVYSDEARAQFHKANPMLRPGTVWDVAQAAAYLASDASNFTTGDVMTLDGGGRYWGELWTAEKPDYFK